MSDSHFWNETQIEPKRAFRWLMYISGVPRFIAKSLKKPSFTVSETPHDFLNYKFYYPGRVEWNTVEITIVDPVQPDSTASLMEILRESGYIPPDEYNSQDGKPKTISKQSAITSLGGQISFAQLGANTGNQTQNEIEHWTLHNPFITNVDFGTLDYSSDELLNISITIRYDWASMTSPNQTWNIERT